MKLKDMTLEQVLRGLKFEYKGYTTAVIGNDDDKTIFIENIDSDEYKEIVNFDVENLNLKKKSDFKSFNTYNAAQSIQNYIIPKLENAKLK